MGGVPAGAGSLVGRRLGKYQLLALLALGGTAEIYLARIEGTSGFEKYVVVKCLHDHLADDEEFVHMFLDEARLGATLDHSNIVQTLELGEQDGRYFMAMEFLAGMSLAMIARKAVERVGGGRIPVPLTLGLAAQAAQGLHYAHERQSAGKPLNIVHRDISPQNLVITFEGVVKIVDFGIAKAEHRETHTRSGTIKGKFAYMSPEQCKAGDVDRRTDVFALGVIVHELITGRRLFKKGSTYDTYQAILEGKISPPSAVNHELDAGLDPVVMKALAYKREDRYPTAEAFGEALIGYLHHRGKFAGPGDVSRFFDQFYQEEIDEHSARMRELLEGREHATSLLTWDAELVSDVATRMPDDVSEHVSLDTGDVMEGSVSRVQEISEVSGLEMVSQVSTISTVSDVGEPPTNPEMEQVDEEGGEKTRIEENPLARVLEMERAAGRPASLAPLPAIPAGPTATAGPPAGSHPHGKRRNAPGTSPPPGGASMATAVSAPAAMRQPVVRDTPRSKSPTAPMTGPIAAPLPPVPARPAPTGAPADVPTVIESMSSPKIQAVRGFAAAPDARTMIHDTGAETAQVLTPPSVQSLVPPPSANPAGAVVNVELPLPAHLISLPAVEQVFTTAELDVMERERNRKVPPWLLATLFAIAMVVALGLAIAIGRAVR